MTKDKDNKIFYTATDEEIKNGDTTDIYFRRTKEILKKKDIEKEVVAEISCGSLPNEWNWGILSGMDELAKLFEGLPVDIDAMPEGEVFRCRDRNGIRLPILNIKGPYQEFCELETPLLGLICQSSGVSTAAARIKKLVGERQVISFGVRRMHPTISPVLDRAAYMGGFDGVSAVLSAQKLGLKPMGTMPHALIIVMGEQKKAWIAFDEIIDKDVPRVALCDTYSDERMESVMAAKAVKDLAAVRLDTPSSRKGKFDEIIKEVRWELDIRGFKDVDIFVSGGLDEESIKPLLDSPVEGFGVGTSVSNAPTVDFAMNIIEIDKKPVAKRGVFGREKQAYRCPECYEYLGKLAEEEVPECCGKTMEPLLKPLMRNGEMMGKTPDIEDIRRNVLEKLKNLEL